MTCECGHHYLNHEDDGKSGRAQCLICGCSGYKRRYDPAYDPDDVADQGYSDEGYPYSGLGKVRR